MRSNLFLHKVKFLVMVTPYMHGSRGEVIAVVSGGIDSTSYLAQWLAKGFNAHALSFIYGQKGGKEVAIAKELVKEINKLNLPGKVVEFRVVDISFMKELWKGTQLTDESVAVEVEYEPTVVVPIRNVIMLAIATAYAYTIRAKYVVFGAHYNDIAPREDTWEPLYPDCSPECVEALQTAFRICHFRSERRIEVWSPSREGVTKAENLRRGYKILGNLIYRTWSCYLSREHHCGRCESCINRHKAFLEAGVPDCTIYEGYPKLSDDDEFVKVSEGYVSIKCRNAQQ